MHLVNSKFLHIIVGSLLCFVCNLTDEVTSMSCLFAVLLSLCVSANVCKQERESEPQEAEEGEEDALALLLQKLRTTSTKLFQLNQAIRQLHSSLSTALRGKAFDSQCQTLTLMYFLDGQRPTLALTDYFLIVQWQQCW